MDTVEHILTERRGRPRKPLGSKFAKVTVSLPPELLAELDKLPGSRSSKVAAAIAERLAGGPQMPEFSHQGRINLSLDEQTLARIEATSAGGTLNAKAAQLLTWGLQVAELRASKGKDAA